LRLLIEGPHSRLDTRPELSAGLHVKADHREAVNTFLDKRKPEFKRD
jgi:hypothetical protein